MWYLCRLASKNLRILRVPPRSSWELRSSVITQRIVVKFLVCTIHEKFWNVLRKKFFAKNCAASSGKFTTTSSRRAQFLANIFCAPHFKIFLYASKSILGANWEFVILNIVFRRGVQMFKKSFPPKNLIYIFWRENISYSHFLSPYFTADTVVLDTRCLCCLRILEPGGLELLNLGLLGRCLIYLLRE